MTKAKKAAVAEIRGELQEEIAHCEARLAELEPRSSSLQGTIQELRLRRVRALRRLETMAAVRDAEGGK
jgi:chromosome segregation ATPase